MKIEIRWSELRQKFDFLVFLFSFVETNKNLGVDERTNVPCSVWGVL
jgi:hypothetical protein